MQIDEQLIAYLEDLSCLRLTDAERERLADDLGKILDRMGQLGSLDVDNVPARSHPFDNANAFRDDVVAPSWPRELILQNAPQHVDGMFVAPPSVTPDQS